MRGVTLVAVLLLCLTGLAVVPTASALPACGNSATATLGDHHVQFGGIRTKIWAEANGHPGLQTQSCVAGGVAHSADRFVRQVVPSDLGFGGPCVFTPVLSQCV